MPAYSNVIKSIIRVRYTVKDPGALPNEKAEILQQFMI
jgi:hypothetical protein